MIIRMDRVFDKAFNKAHGAVHAVTGSAVAQEKQAEQSKDDALRTLTTPVTATDVVERISLAYKDKDFFRCDKQSSAASKASCCSFTKALWPFVSV